MLFTTSINDVLVYEYRLSKILHTPAQQYQVGRTARTLGTIRSISLPILSSHVNALKSDIIATSQDVPHTPYVYEYLVFIRGILR